MNAHPQQAVIIIGRDEPEETLLAEAQRYDEVVVIARAVPHPSERWIVDDDRAHDAARARLARTLTRLRARGVEAWGAVGDGSAAATRRDAHALFPTAKPLAA